MALRDRIMNYKPVATATLATVATLGTKEQRTVARVAIVAVADEGKKGKSLPSADRQLGQKIDKNVDALAHSANTPVPCRKCERLELLEIMGKSAHGCLYTAPGEYPYGWRRLPDDIDKCLYGHRRWERQSGSLP